MYDPKKRNDYIIIVLVCLAMLLAAAVANRYYFRLDLTQSRENSLSASARNLYRELPQNLRITYFISRSLAERHHGPAVIEDFLRELEAVSRGRISLRIENPDANPEKAESFGLYPQQMQVLERNEQRVALVYSGIVIEYLDDYHSLPAVLSADTLEYDLIKAIRGLLTQTSPVAGLLIGDANRSVEDYYSLLAGHLQQNGYQPRVLARSQPIEDDVSVLFVLGNSALDRYDAWYIDDYLLRGGRVFFAVRGVDIDIERGLVATPVAGDGILNLLSAYGIDIRKQLVLDQASLTVPFQVPNARGSYSIQYLQYPHWLSIQQRFVNRQHPITGGFPGLSLLWPSPLYIQPWASLETVRLVSSSPLAWLQTSSFLTAPEDAQRFAAEQETSLGSYALAVAAHGRPRSAFTDGDLPSREGAPPLALPVEAAGDSRLVVVSSTDFLSDLLAFSQSEFNLSFALAAADWLSSAEDLIALRSRTERDLRLNRIQDSFTRDALILLTYIVCIGLVPLLVGAWAMMRAMARRRQEAACRRQ